MENMIQDIADEIQDFINSEEFDSSKKEYSERFRNNILFGVFATWEELDEIWGEDE